MEQRSSVDDEPTLANPTDLDVILGRGNGVNLHPGNVVFRQLTAARAHQYANTDRRDHKDLIARQVMLEIHRHGGRFVRAVMVPHAEWRVVSEAKVMAKVKQALRDAALSLKRNQSSSSHLDLRPRSETGPVSTMQNSRFDGQSFTAQGRGLTRATASFEGQMRADRGSSLPQQSPDIGHRAEYPTNSTTMYQPLPCDNPAGDSTSTTTSTQPSTSLRKTHSPDHDTGEDNEDSPGRKQASRNTTGTRWDRQTSRNPESPVFYDPPASTPGTQAAVFLSHSPTLDLPTRPPVTNLRRRKRTADCPSSSAAEEDEQPPRSTTQRKRPPGPASNDRNETG